MEGQQSEKYNQGEVLTEPQPLLEAKLTNDPELADPSRNVRLELLPPVSQKALMEFYQGLSRMKEVQILQVLGSVDKGVLVYMRPRQLIVLPPLLQALPGVREVVSTPPSLGTTKGNGVSEGNDITLRILLAPMVS